MVKKIYLVIQQTIFDGNKNNYIWWLKNKIFYGHKNYMFDG